ncbi:MAG: MCE family protein [Sphingobacteriales bacterium]|nr:MAG: MCE family protein [Sphingobacteriales bacterium]
MAEETKSNLKARIITTVIFVAACIIAFSIMKRNKKRREYDYYAYFNDVAGLARSSQVQINGVRVGKITDVQITEDRRLKVIITTVEGVELPEGTIASLASGGLTGDKIVKLLPGKGPGILPDKATLVTNLDTSVLPMSARIKPLMKTAKVMLRGSDSILRAFNLFMSSGLVANTANDLIYLEKETKSFSLLSEKYNTQTGDLAKQIDDANRSTASAAKNFKDLSAKIKDAEQSTRNTANKDLVSNVKQLQGNIQSLNKNLKKLNSADDRLGKLVSDKKDYGDVSGSLGTLNANLQSTYDDPPGFTIFGSSKKKKTTTVVDTLSRK